MRVSDRTTARNYLVYMNQAKADYAKTSEQIFTGNRFEQLSEDVSAGTRVLRIRMDRFKEEQQLDNVETVYDELTVIEKTMDSMEDIIADVLNTKMVKAMNDPTGESGREAIANEIEDLRDQLMQLANTAYSERYVFGDANSSPDAPFEMDDNGVLFYHGIDVSTIQKDNDGYFYNDAAGVRQSIPMDNQFFVDVGLGIEMQGSDVDIDTAMQVSYSGLDLLGFGVDADGKSQNIFVTMFEAEQAIRSGDMEVLDDTHHRLSDQHEYFLASLTDVGGKTTMLETLKTRLNTSIDGHTERIDMLMGTDDAEAATTLKMNDYVLSAVLQMGSQILPVTLMDFLR